MRNDYVEAKPRLLSNINIVPLVGVLAALLIVINDGFPKHHPKNIPVDIQGIVGLISVRIYIHLKYI